MTCQHWNFEAAVNVNRLTRSDDDPTVIGYVAEVHVRCVECGQTFRFNCPDVGQLQDRPCISANGQELRVYLEPSDGSLQGSAKLVGFRVQASAPPPKHSEN